MAESRANPNFGPSLDEGVMLAWIEGELAPDRQAELARVHPDMARVVGRMRRDRAMLAEACNEPAPAGLAEGILAALEREALFDDTRPAAPRGTHRGLVEPETDFIPVSQVQVVRGPGVLARIGRAPRAVMAAGIALLLGAGAMWGYFVMNRAGPLQFPGKGTIVADANDQNRLNQNTDGMTIANAETTDMSPVDGLLGHADAAMVPAPAAMIADFGPVASIGFDEAVDLATRGRLALRVVGVDASKLLKSANLSLAGGGTMRWTNSISPTTHDAVVAWLAQHAPLARVAKEASTPADPVVVSLGPGLPPIVLPRHEAPRAAFAPATPLTASVEMSPTPESLQALAEALALEGAVTVELTELPIAAEGPQDLDAESVFWWTRPSAEWTPKVTIPVIFEP
ncbi:MAG: hypothetical protein IPK69_07065 [Phycisphaerales bacterium]|nr:MAG: hypothetical protein IPK69_07065 [Phycisphaerales bacterium]